MAELTADAPEMFADAQAYERFMGRHSRRLAPLFADFIGLERAGRILDVGTGTGVLAAALVARAAQYSVVGIDLSAQYAQFAQAQVGSERVRCERGDAQDLAFPAASFDAAASLLVFNFIPRPRQALSELRRVVRRGGVIAAAVWDYSDGMQMLRLFWDAAVSLDPAADARDEKRMPLCRAGELGALWQAAGLADVSERSLEAPLPFASFADYWEPFRLGQGPAGAYVASLAAGPRERLRSELKRRLPPGPFALRARVWAVRGIN